ncbi:sensor histidine kinase [Paracoccus zhouxuedongae]|uniref:sensor histidine kinase n=1 Tax=Paracoccus sp. p4-l81 TaxID=3342806 RepID=UPI0035BBD0AF
MRSLATLWVLAAFGLGLALGVIWLGTRLAWDRHMTAARLAGAALYGGLAHGTPAPQGLAVQALSGADAGLADAGDFARLSFAPNPVFVTFLTVRGAPQSGLDQAPNLRPDGPGLPPPFPLAILSPRLAYPVARLPSPPGQTGPDKLGEVLAMVAGLCSDATLVGRDAGGQWHRIDGPQVWSCAAQPRDPRLIAAIAAALVLAALLGRIATISGRFASLAASLRDRAWLGGPDRVAVDGPAELRELAQIVNAHLADERAQLARRAEILSGISHDLGTPATRLRLRAALIGDPALRDRFDRDLDEISGMIAAMLAYSRAEIETEPPRALSLTALIEAVAADYQDTGQPVALGAAPALRLDDSGSVFAPARGGTRMRGDTLPVLVTGRPLALRRAATNLIDNALKYGRRATVWIEADSTQASICVQDEGGDLTPEALADLSARYARGGNAGSQPGSGLGLAIVATIAAQHGGALSFDSNSTGMLARMTIRRGRQPLG